MRLIAPVGDALGKLVTAYIVPAPGSEIVSAGPGAIAPPPVMLASVNTAGEPDDPTAPLALFES